MSRTIENVLFNSDNVLSLLQKLNTVIDTFQETVTTSSSNSNPELTVGHAYVSGSLGSNVVTAQILKGGNSTSNSTLIVSSNVNFTGEQINVASYVLVSNNIYIENGTLKIGNSSANATVNSTFYTGSVNNASYAYGKAEAALSVNNSLYFNGQLSSYYTNATNLSTGIIPDARIIGTYTGITTLVIGSNTAANSTVITTDRMDVKSVNVSSDIYVAGNLNVLGTTTTVGNSVATGDLVPASDALYKLGNTSTRWIVYASSVTSPSVEYSYSYENSNTVTTTAVTPQLVDTFSASLYRSAKYLLSVKDNNSTNYNASEVIVVHDSTEAYLTEYATVATSSIIGTCSANVSGTTVRLYYTPSSNSTVIKLHRTLIEV